MKLATLAILATVAFPLAAYADSSQPNSAPGLEGQPVTPHGEGTTGRNRGSQPGMAAPRTNGMGTTDAGKTGHGGTAGASDSSIPGATNPNEPVRGRQ